MKHHISTQIIINKDLKTVWSIFTNFDDYPNWNPLITSIKGNIAVGEKFQAEITGTKFKPTTQVYAHEKELTWLGRLLFPGIFDGRHSFLFQSNSDGSTTLIHKEDFKGILVPFLRKKLNTQIRQKFEAMNEKLKELAENE